MAQSRNRRQQRVRARSDKPPIERAQSTERGVRLRRIVIALLLLVGLAGVLALSPPADGDGAPPVSILGVGGDR